MLNGQNPVIVFSLAPFSTKQVLSKLGINISSSSFFNFKIPFMFFPFYLNEETMDIVVDDHERVINLDWEVDDKDVYSRAVSTDVRMTLKAPKGNIAFRILTSIFEMVLKLADPNLYTIYLYYDDVFMLDAGLKDFQSRTVENTDTRLVTFTLTDKTVRKESIEESILSKVTDSLGGFNGG